MKKAFVFLCILICIYAVPCRAAITEIDTRFETETDASVWNGAVFDESAAYEGFGGAIVKNPFGTVNSGLVTNVLELSDTIYLEAGQMYTLSGYALNPVASSDAPRTNASLERGGRTVIIYVNGCGDEWSHFTANFYAHESGEFNLSVYFENTDEELGIFVDNISLKSLNAAVAAVKLLGSTSLLVPAQENIKLRYSPVLITANGDNVYLLNGAAIHSYITDYDGVSYDADTLTLTVTPTAHKGSFYIEYALRDAPDIPPGSLLVSVTDSLITAPSTSEELVELWQGDTLELAGGVDTPYIGVYTDKYENYGYHTVINCTKPQLLVKDTLYVLRMRIKSTLNVTKPVFAANTVSELGNTVCFEIKDISGTDWYDVSAAFVPENSGIYDISLSLFSTEPCYIFADDIRLLIEAPSADYVTIHAPGSIALPDCETGYRVEAYVRNQLGEILSSESCGIYLKEIVDGISCDGAMRTLTVSPDAPAGKYTIVAYCESDPDIFAELPFTVSSDFIGDGDFESSFAGELWMVNSPYSYVFNLASSSDNRYADIACDGDYFILLSNSYIHFSESTPYTFLCRARPSTDVSVTVFLDSDKGEKLPLLQFYVAAHHSLDELISPQLFLSEYDSCGRLFLYVQSDNGEPFDIIFDDVSMSKAIIKVAAPVISGDLSVNGSAKAVFGFFSNIDPTSDDSGCVVNWYISDNESTNFVQLSETGRYIYFDTSFAEKYVYFDVTPVCPITGFSGDTLKSGVVRIIGNFDDVPNDYSEVLPSTTAPSDEKTNTPHFSDIEQHWAKNEILRLADLGILNGTSPDTFSPDKVVSRAEAAKMLATAFSLKAYSSGILFSDVSAADWFCPYVCALYENGITSGTGVSHFSPYDSVTREELTCMLVRIYEKTTSSVLSSGNIFFKDIASVSDWALDSVFKLTELGILRGDDEGFVRPSKLTTRAEAAVLTDRLYEVLENEA